MLNYFHIVLIYLLSISTCWCQNPQQIIVPVDQPFSFDCKQDELVYFGRRSGDWLEVQENNPEFSHLNLKFTNPPRENVLRITCDSAQSQNIGYYGCRKPTLLTTAMTRVYQLVLADIHSFYWSYICHGPVGSCSRTDDSLDENSSTFEVADQTNIDLFCCVSATGYKDVNINMNQIGNIHGKIDVKRKQELDGTWVVCANQHTLLTRASIRNQQVMTCELKIDQRPHSTLSSVIVMKDRMPNDPDMEPYTPPPKGGGHGGGDSGYFVPIKPSNVARGKRLTTGKKIAIILGSVFGGLLLIGLLFLVFCLYCKNHASKSSKTNHLNDYYAVNTYQSSRKTNRQNPKEEEPTYYIEPTPLYENLCVPSNS